MRSSNPTLKANTFTGVGPAVGDEVMTLQGTVNKTGLLLLLVLATSVWSWSLVYTAPEIVSSVMLGGVLGGLVFALITTFKKSWAMVTAPIYALLEGLLLGGMSSLFEAQYPGIVIQAIGLTTGTLACLLLAYTSGWIKATENFKLGVAAATGGILLFYLATLGLSFFGISIPFVFGNSLIGIGFSLFVVIIAALNLVLDFDFIESGVASGAPKYMEWYGAFALIVTLIWLYLEILRLLAKLRSRD
jgi:uncharacterized YccA/Bax inhibitor family protein